MAPQPRREPGRSRSRGDVLDSRGMAAQVRPLDPGDGSRALRPVILVVDDEPGLRESFRLILDDEYEVIARQIGRGVTPVLRVLLAMRAKGIVNAVARRATARKPVAAWGLQQGMHITGTRTAYDFLRSSTRFSTRRVSQLVTADVLLLAGADDHYVPLKQLRRQAANLVRARSVTTRTFTAAEQASNHCQVGNIGAAVRVIQGWLEVSTISRVAEKAGAPTRAMPV